MPTLLDGALFVLFGYFFIRSVILEQQARTWRELAEEWRAKYEAAESARRELAGTL